MVENVGGEMQLLRVRKHLEVPDQIAQGSFVLMMEMDCGMLAGSVLRAPSLPLGIICCWNMVSLYHVAFA